MRSLRHLILLYPFLLASLADAQQHRKDTLIVHFKVDQCQLRPSDTLKIHDLIFRVDRDNLKVDSILITGYTDKTGTIAHNRRLAEKRADAAANALALPGNNLPRHISGGGVAPTPELTDSANRRAEIIICYYAYPPSAPQPTAGADRPQPAASPGDTLRLTAIPRTDSTQPSAILSLQHINFVLDTPIPTAATRMILPGYVTQLQRYKDRYLEIDGFVNSFVPLRGPTDPLFILSVKRAKYIYDYLVDAGFDPNKLTYKGMGNASPINPDPATREEMNANMRVEIKVY